MFDASIQHVNGKQDQLSVEDLGYYIESISMLHSILNGSVDKLTPISKVAADTIARVSKSTPLSALTSLIRGVHRLGTVISLTKKLSKVLFLLFIVAFLVTFFVG